MIQNNCYIRKTENIEHSVKKASFKYQNYPSITKFKCIMKLKIFPLSIFSLFNRESERYNKTLDTKKACPDGGVPLKLIKKTYFQD